MVVSAVTLAQIENSAPLATLQIQSFEMRYRGVPTLTYLTENKVGDSNADGLLKAPLGLFRRHVK